MELTAMYDIGVGAFRDSHADESFLVSALCPDIKIFGCDPCHKVHKARWQDYPGTLLNVGLGTQTGWKPLYVDRSVSKMGFHTTRKPTIGREEEEQVYIMRLDDFDNWARPLYGDFHEAILLWLDVDGNELDILRSGLRLLKSGRVKTIVVEVQTSKHPDTQGWTKAEDVNHFLYSNRYYCKSRNNPRIHDNFVFEERVYAYRGREEAIPKRDVPVLDPGKK